MAKYLALVVALGVALAAAADEKKEAKPEPQKKGDRWEYAELHHTAGVLRGAFGGGGGVGGGGKGGGGGGGQVLPAKLKAKMTWVTGDGETEGESWDDLAAKLKAPAAKDAKPAASKVKLLNYLGDQGWELVSSDGSVMTFKRKATK